MDSAVRSAAVERGGGSFNSFNLFIHSTT
eukprot:COSAG05_NODE_11614_length_505_cov_0.633005_1_plen_28_part_01